MEAHVARDMTDALIGLSVLELALPVSDGVLALQLAVTEQQHSILDE
jgi:hypothetical protein